MSVKQAQPAVHDPVAQPPKRVLGKPARLLRLVLAALDPRAYLHVFRILNYYNYSHVQPRRLMQEGAGCAISPNLSLTNGERIRLGDRVRIGSRCHLWAGNHRGHIVLDDDVLLGPEVFITASSYLFNQGQPVTAQPMLEADVHIGRDAWLGARVMVMPGVTIGEGAVIGAGSVVTRDVAPFAIAVGNPARVVGQRTLDGRSNPTGDPS